MLNQWHHNLLLDEGVLLEVLPQAKDVIHHVHHVVVIDLWRQILKDDVQQVIEFALDVAVSGNELVDAVGRVTLTAHQGADVREDVALLMSEMLLDFGFILLEEADEHLSDATFQVLGDGVEVTLDVRQTLINIIAVGLLQIRHQAHHVSPQYRRC